MLPPLCPRHNTQPVFTEGSLKVAVFYNNFTELKQARKPYGFQPKWLPPSSFPH